MNLFRTSPLSDIVPVRGAGCTIWDQAGRAYLDLRAGVWALALGYAHPRFTTAMQAQMGRLTHCGSEFVTSEMQAALDRLESILPPALNRVTLLSSGSEAVDLAVKIARASTGKHQIVRFEKGYYGATTQTFSLSEPGRHVDYVPRQSGPALTSPFCIHCPLQRQFPECAYACLSESAARLEAEMDMADVAAIVFEPVQGSGGNIVPPEGYLREVAALARRWDVLLIANEVTTGLGRTGCWFGFERGECVPDILTLGKILGNGLPVSAVIASAAVEEACFGKLRHAQSHQNDPLAGHAAATVIDILRDEKLVERSAAMGALLLAGLKQLQNQHPLIADARGQGLMLAFELQAAAPQAAAALQDDLVEKGILLNFRPATNTFLFFPPFVIQPDEIERTLQTLDDSLRHMETTFA